MQRNSSRVVAVVVTAVVVAGYAIGFVATPTAGATAADTATVSVRPSTVRGSRLSPRLERWSQADVQARPSAERSAALSVGDSGPGSLLARPGGRILVEVLLVDTSPATVAAVTGTGARLVSVSATDPLATIEVRPADVAALRNVPSVRYAQEVLRPEVHGTGAPASGGATIAGAGCAGRLIDEADTQLNVATERAIHPVDGFGVQVGILSDSFDRLGGAGNDIRGGELPGDENPCGRNVPVRIQSEAGADLTDPSDEGRAMAQAVHDLAPGAPIAFATAMNGESAFADQVRALQANGASVITDDIAYYGEPMYQDGVISKAITDVTAAGVTYFSAAGNNNAIVGTDNVSSYEATNGYRPTSCPAGVDGGTVDCHDFDPSGGTDNGDVVTLAAGAGLAMSLGWNEPQQGIVTDLDLYLYDVNTSTVVAESISSNVDGQKAFEFISFTNPTGATHSYRLVVGRFKVAGTPRFKFVMHQPDGIVAVQWHTSTGGDIVGPTLVGHAANGVGAAVAAVPYNNSSTVEFYSSRGPSTICYGPVTGPVAATPLPSCQTKQLDIAATDGGQNSFLGQVLGDGRWHFFGTSQAAPHAAAIAAIQREAHPCRTPAQVLAAQRASGRAVGSFGIDAAGSGLVDAVGAVAGLGVCAAAPGAPRDVRASVVASKTVAVTWSVPVVDVAFPVTSYKVTASPGGATCQWSAGPLSCTLGGLTDGTNYTLSVRATNAIGPGPVAVVGPVMPYARVPFGASSGAGAPVVVGTSLDGRLELFGTDRAGALIHAWQLTPNGTWSNWQWMGTFIQGSPTVTRSADGRLELFAQDLAGGLIHSWQLAPNGVWSGWQWTGVFVAGAPTPGIAPDGRIELFATDTGGALIHTWQLAPNGTWSGWQWMGVRVQGPPSVAASADGRLELFAADIDTGGLMHSWQLSPNGIWSDWRWEGVYVTGAPTAGVAPDGRIELFASAPGGVLIHTWQLAPNGVWSGWQGMGATVKGAPSVAASADGRLELFAVDPNGGLIHSWQLAPNGVWSGWTWRGVYVKGAPAVGVAPDRRLEMFAADGAGGVIQTWQLTPNGTWSAWRWMGIFVR